MIKQAEFLTSVGTVAQMQTHYPIEIAVAGKSNVGKSSFINFICRQNKLAKTSKEPGRTRLINYFDINKGEFVLVDLPGYGFARVSDEEKKKWGVLIEHYFQFSSGLKHVFLLLDIRHNPTTEDMDMLKYMYYYNIPFTIIATKADKLSRSAALAQKKVIANYVGVGIDDIIISSSVSRQGADEIFNKIDHILNLHKEGSDNAEV